MQSIKTRRIFVLTKAVTHNFITTTKYNIMQLSTNTANNTIEITTGATQNFNAATRVLAQVEKTENGFAVVYDSFGMRSRYIAEQAAVAKQYSTVSEALAGALVGCAAIVELLAAAKFGQHVTFEERLDAATAAENATIEPAVIEKNNVCLSSELIEKQDADTEMLFNDVRISMARGWYKLLVDGEVWDLKENDKVKILSIKVASEPPYCHNYGGGDIYDLRISTGVTAIEIQEFSPAGDTATDTLEKRGYTKSNGIWSRHKAKACFSVDYCTMPTDCFHKGA